MTWPQTSSLQRQPDWRGSGNQLWTRRFFALLSDKWRNPRLSISQNHRTAMWTVVRCPMQAEFALKLVDHNVGWHGVSKKVLLFKLHTKTYVLTRPLASLQILPRDFPRHNLATPLLPSERRAHFLHLPRVWKNPTSPPAAYHFVSNWIYLGSGDREGARCVVDSLLGPRRLQVGGCCTFASLHKLVQCRCTGSLVIEGSTDRRPKPRGWRSDAVKSKA